MLIIDILVLILTVLIFFFFAGSGPGGAMLGVILFPFILAFDIIYYFVRITNFASKKFSFGKFLKPDISNFIAAVVVAYTPLVFLDKSLTYVLWSTNGMSKIFWAFLISYLLASLFIWIAKRIFSKFWILAVLILLVIVVSLAWFLGDVVRSGGSKITFEELENAQYFVPEYNKMIKFKDGYYGESIGGYNTVRFWRGHVAYGDLSNDGKEDAALILEFRGINRIAVMLNKNGRPSYLTQKSLDFIGSGSSVASIDINSGIITVGVYVDAGYRQTRPLKIFKYKLSGDQLVDVR